MASTVIVAVRAALVDALAALPTFTGIPVAYCYDKTCMEQREFLYTRDARFDHSVAALKAGRSFREESGTFELVVWVESVGGSPREAATRALALGLVVEEYVADHKNGVGGARSLQVAGAGALSEMASDSSSFAELVYPVRYEARLT